MNRRALITAIIALLAVLAAPLTAHSADRSTPGQARALFEKAVAFMESQGPEKAFAAFNDPKGQFVAADLYVFALDLEGTCYANGASPATWVGMNIRETRDAAGRPLIREMIELAKTKGEGSVSYVWLDRLNNKVEYKTSFVKRMGDYLIGVGYYTPRASAEEARSFLAQAVTYMQQHGAEKAFAAFNSTRGEFVRGDLYVFALDFSGTYRASGINPGLVGLNVRETRDAAGKPLFQEMIEVAKTKGEGTIEYVWRNPLDNRVENKHSFIKRVGEYFVGVGYYSN